MVHLSRLLGIFHYAFSYVFLQEGKTFITPEGERDVAGYFFSAFALVNTKRPNHLLSALVHLDCDIYRRIRRCSAATKYYTRLR